MVDYSDENYKRQIEVTEQTLKEIDCADIPVIYVFNKAERCMDELPRVSGDNRIYMAAGKGIGIEELAKLISDRLHEHYRQEIFLIPYDKGQILSYLMEHAQVKRTEYTEDGIRMEVSCSREDASRYSQYSC